MNIINSIIILLLILLLLLILSWYYEAFNEYYEIPICDNIYKLMEEHQKYLIKAYKRLEYNKEISKKLEHNLNEPPPPENFLKIAENLDFIASCYNYIGKNVHSRDIYLHALKLRQWYLPNKHVEIEKNIINLLMIYSELCDDKNARYMFELQMKNRAYITFLNKSDK